MWAFVTPTPNLSICLINPMFRSSWAQMLKFVWKRFGDFTGMHCFKQLEVDSWQRFQLVCSLLWCRSTLFALNSSDESFHHSDVSTRLQARLVPVSESWLKCMIESFLTMCWCNHVAQPESRYCLDVKEAIKLCDENTIGTSLIAQ